MSIAAIGERLRAWHQIGGKPMCFEHMYIADEYQYLLALRLAERRDRVICFAEQRADRLCLACAEALWKDFADQN